jgi:hypothetical protein
MAQINEFLLKREKIYHLILFRKNFAEYDIIFSTFRLILLRKAKFSRKYNKFCINLIKDPGPSTVTYIRWICRMRVGKQWERHRAESTLPTGTLYWFYLDNTYISD